MLYKLLGLMGLSLCVLACDREYTYQYLTTHPKILEQVLANCQQTSLSDATSSIDCVNAENARQEVAGLLNEVTANLQGFGQKILAAQNTLADLEFEYHKRPSEKLQAAVTSQQDYIDRLLAITSYIGE